MYVCMYVCMWGRLYTLSPGSMSGGTRVAAHTGVANLSVRGITLSTQNCIQTGSCPQGGLEHINKHNSESSTADNIPSPYSEIGYIFVSTSPFFSLNKKIRGFFSFKHSCGIKCGDYMSADGLSSSMLAMLCLPLSLPGTREFPDFRSA